MPEAGKEAAVMNFPGRDRRFTNVVLKELDIFEEKRII
jgi:hypothetical protein